MGLRSYQSYAKYGQRAAFAAIRLANRNRVKLNNELKFSDSSFSSTVGTTPTATHLTAIGAGTGVSARVGQSIKMVALYLRGALQANASATNTYFRFIIVQDKWQQGTPPTYSDIYGSNAVTAFKEITDDRGRRS